MELIPAHQLNNHHFCPRKTYLTLILGLKDKRLEERNNTKKTWKTLILSCKDLLMEYPGKKELMEGMLMRLKGQHTQTLHDALTGFCNEFQAMEEDMGIEKAIRHIIPAEYDLHLKSPEDGLSGVIDFAYNIPQPIMSSIKTKSPSKLSQADQIQAAAYKTLFDRHHGIKSEYCLLEFISPYERTHLTVNEKTTCQLQTELSGIREIIKGQIPEPCPHGNTKKCENCSMEKECYTN
jgi:CRISPR/Cas system-associated exonuclease Cas4 (RecB family)